MDEFDITMVSSNEIPYNGDEKRGAGFYLFLFIYYCYLTIFILLFGYLLKNFMSFVHCIVSF